MDILYCFDERYNTQGYISIESVKRNINRNLNIYIIHNNPESFQNYFAKLKDSRTNLIIKKFTNEEQIVFPNLNESHISEATYYRLFLSDYLDKNIKSIMYIDADAICLSDFSNEYNFITDQLSKSNHTIAAKSIPIENETDDDIKKRIGVGSRYFNAGVLFIDLSKWNNNDTKSSLIKRMKYLNEKIKYWDQDVLNAHFDGDYLELDRRLNFQANHINKHENVQSNAYILHYIGSNKPWNLKQSLKFESSFYQNLCLEYLKKYHIVSNFRKGDLIILLSQILSLEVLKSKKLISYLKSSIFAIFFKK